MKTMQIKKTIPVFYAADENYFPYLAVSLHSLKENASKAYNYAIYVLCEGVSETSRERLEKYADEYFTVTFVNVKAKMEEVKQELELRDYYTGATYYRIFIAELFPQYDKALYFDCDTVITGDVSELFNVNLGNNLVGAVPDGVVAAVPQFAAYTEQGLGIQAKNYFNAGVLCIHLAEWRKDNFYNKFCKLLCEYKFTVAQDQDYLNVLCKDRVQYIGEEWNKMPMCGERESLPKLVHFNLTAKPWRYVDVPYAKLFWGYAAKTEYYEKITADFAAYSGARIRRDETCEKNLIALAEWETKRPDGYYKLQQAKQSKRVMPMGKTECVYVENFTGTPAYSKAH